MPRELHDDGMIGGVGSPGAGSMAPGFETADALRKSKSSPEYWATKDPGAKKDAA